MKFNSFSQLTSALLVSSALIGVEPMMAMDDLWDSEYNASGVSRGKRLSIKSDGMMPEEARGNPSICDTAEEMDDPFETGSQGSVVERDIGSDSDGDGSVIMHGSLNGSVVIRSKKDEQKGEKEVADWRHRFMSPVAGEHNISSSSTKQNADKEEVDNGKFMKKLAYSSIVNQIQKKLGDAAARKFEERYPRSTSGFSDQVFSCSDIVDEPALIQFIKDLILERVSQNRKVQETTVREIVGSYQRAKRIGNGSKKARIQLSEDREDAAVYNEYSVLVEDVLNFILRKRVEIYKAEETAGQVKLAGTDVITPDRKREKRVQSRKKDMYPLADAAALIDLEAKAALAEQQELKAKQEKLYTQLITQIAKKLKKTKDEVSTLLPEKAVFTCDRVDELLEEQADNLIRETYSSQLAALLNTSVEQLGEEALNDDNLKLLPDSIHHQVADLIEKAGNERDELYNNVMDILMSVRSEYEEEHSKIYETTLGKMQEETSKEEGTADLEKEKEQAYASLRARLGREREEREERIAKAKQKHRQRKLSKRDSIRILTSKDSSKPSLIQKADELFKSTGGENSSLGLKIGKSADDLLRNLKEIQVASQSGSSDLLAVLDERGYKPERTAYEEHRGTVSGKRRTRKPSVPIKQLGAEQGKDVHYHGDAKGFDEKEKQPETAKDPETKSQASAKKMKPAVDGPQAMMAAIMQAGVAQQSGEKQGPQSRRGMPPKEPSIRDVKEIDARKAAEEARLKKEEDIRNAVREEAARQAAIKQSTAEKSGGRPDSKSKRGMPPSEPSIRDMREIAARKAAEEEARLKAEEEARLKVEEEARLKAEEEARLKVEEEARLKAEEEARLKKEEDIRNAVREEAARQAAIKQSTAEKSGGRPDSKSKRGMPPSEPSIRDMREIAARKAAEEEARLKAEEESRLKAEEEARLKAEEEARLKAEEEARLKAEEEVRLKAEEEARLKAEEEAAKQKRLEEEQRAQAERNRLAREAEDQRARAERDRLAHEAEEQRAQAERERLAREQAQRAQRPQPDPVQEELRRQQEEAARQQALHRQQIEAARREALHQAELHRQRSEAARLAAQEQARLQESENVQNQLVVAQVSPPAVSKSEPLSLKPKKVRKQELRLRKLKARAERKAHKRTHPSRWERILDIVSKKNKSKRHIAKAKRKEMKRERRQQRRAWKQRRARHAA